MRVGGAKGGEELRFVLDLMTNPGEEGSTRPLPKLTTGTELSDPKEVARLSLSLSTFHANTFGYLPRDRMGKGMGRDRIGRVAGNRRRGGAAVWTPVCRQEGLESGRPGRVMGQNRSWNRGICGCCSTNASVARSGLICRRAWKRSQQRAMVESNGQSSG